VNSRQPFAVLRLSPATARLASEYGLQLRTRTFIQWVAGLRADLCTLAILLELGMPLRKRRLLELLSPGRSDVLQHLLYDRQCHIPHGIDHYAAESGNISILKWLKAERWCPYNEGTCTLAAARGHLKALKYLRSIGCEWEEHDVAADAACSGSIEVMKWLRQQEDIVINARVLAAAAACNHVGMCQYLRSIGCKFTHSACKQAAAHGRLSTLHWTFAMAAAARRHSD
jgi:hypothetical protein